MVIETTGLADPGPVAQTFFVDADIADTYFIDSIVTVIDAKHAEQHLDEGHEAQEQVAFADVLLINKTDLVTEEEASNLEKRLKGINSTAVMYRTLHSQIDLKHIFDINSFDLKQKLEIDPHFLDEEDHHHHDDSVKSIVIREEKPLDLGRLETWMNGFIQEHGTNLFRYKGILSINGIDERIIFQGIHMLFAAEADRLWKKNEVRISEMVFIGRDLDEKKLTETFKHCLADL